uniref:Secreted protein n=1 Tax=Caenorhabditis tropicalis TaxID=1561998 RepID=A0A1I7T160_9PELO
MWIWLSSLFWALIVVSIAKAVKSDASINEVLQTDHYMLVTQQDNYFRYLESNITSGECPQAVTNPTK